MNLSALKNAPLYGINTRPVPSITLTGKAKPPYLVIKNDIEEDSFSIHTHKRHNSDQLPDVHTIMKTSNSWTESMDPRLELLLPTSLIEEISDKESSSAALSLDGFEGIFADKGAEEAKKYFSDLVVQETDEKEKGKLYRSAAEIAKRLSEVRMALDFYQCACSVDPSTPASWIDRAKLLDELGEYKEAETILFEGSQRVSHSEQIVRKLLKSYERTNNLDAARNFLVDSMKRKSFEEDFILVEGSLFELRQGNVVQAMKILESVRTRSSWKANVYSELVQFFEKSGNTDSAFDIVEEGTKLNPRNAVVCQAYLKHQKDPLKAIDILRETSVKWTAEFKDKMTNVVCERLAECGEIKEMRNLMAESLAACSSKQRYKLLLFAAVIELIHGEHAIAPLLLEITLRITPFKSKPLVSILLAKVFELDGHYDKAEALFQAIASEFSAEWRIFLEFAQFYIHRNNIHAAIEILKSALKLHQGSGRLWAFRVQLEGFNSVESQINILKASIQAVPKSGEVWCEAARIAMNPLSEYFNTESAKLYLDFAYRFTPQHGDTLIEMLRVELLEKGFSADLSSIRQKFISSEGNYGQLFLFIKHLNDRPMNEVFDDAVIEVKKDIQKHSRIYARALARSSFVIKSIFEEEQKLKNSKKELSPSLFVFGLTRVGEMMLDPQNCETKEQKMSIIIGTSACSQ